MPIRLGFRFRWVPFAAAMAVVAIGIALGQWQMRRAAEKAAIETTLAARESAPVVRLDEAPVAAEELEYRRVQVRGEFRRDWPVYLENRPYRGVAGFYVLMPLNIAGSGRTVLVARGWLPRNPADRAQLPPLVTPPGLQDIRGMARRNPGRLLQLGAAAVPYPGAIVQNLDLAAFGKASGLRLQPVLIEQTSALQDGLVRDWPRPSSGVDKHRGYAFQWYALAATAWIFFVVTGFRHGTK